jgi:YidC/Oxa1 family membrane protein insertase
MFDLIATVLAWFYELWPSYGMAIVFLTLAVMVILTPLTLKGTRSMLMLQQLQPEVKKLQQKYKDDRQKLNEEMLKFYKENQINPVGGCLPLLIQLPVFLVLFRVVSGLTQRVGFWAVLANPEISQRTFDPAYLDQGSALYQSLKGSTEMVSWGIDLSRSATQAMQESFSSAIPYLVLVIGVAVTSYIQQWQISGRNPSAAANPQQQLLLRIMPAFFALISLSFPAALVVYFFVSNLYRVGQQAFITHKIYKPHHAATAGALDTTAREVSTDDEPKKSAPKAVAAGSTARVAGAAPKGGFLDRLLGDAKPRLGKAAPPAEDDSGQGNGSKDRPAAQPARPISKSGTAAGNRAARTGGRATPRGSSNARKKRKKKR